MSRRRGLSRCPRGRSGGPAGSACWPGPDVAELRTRPSLSPWASRQDAAAADSRCSDDSPGVEAPGRKPATTAPCGPGPGAPTRMVYSQNMKTRLRREGVCSSVTPRWAWRKLVHNLPLRPARLPLVAQLPDLAEGWISAARASAPGLFPQDGMRQQAAWLADGRGPFPRWVWSLEAGAATPTPTPTAASSSSSGRTPGSPPLHAVRRVISGMAVLRKIAAAGDDSQNGPGDGYPHRFTRVPAHQHRLHRVTRARVRPRRPAPAGPGVATPAWAAGPRRTRPYGVRGCCDNVGGHPRQ
jgi:hypothetical protein